MKRWNTYIHTYKQTDEEVEEWMNTYIHTYRQADRHS